jgi:hypothetical protein
LAVAYNYGIIKQNDGHLVAIARRPEILLFTFYLLCALELIITFS